jgi:hypothetical protein
MTRCLSNCLSTERIFAGMLVIWHALTLAITQVVPTFKEDVSFLVLELKGAREIPFLKEQFTRGQEASPIFLSNCCLIFCVCRQLLLIIIIIKKCVIFTNYIKYNRPFSLLQVDRFQWPASAHDPEANGGHPGLVTASVRGPRKAEAAVARGPNVSRNTLPGPLVARQARDPAQQTRLGCFRMR